MLVNVRRIIAMAMILISNAALAELNITDATVRLLPPSVPNTSAYFTLQNISDKNVTLVGAQAGIANKAELHNHIMHGDVMRMEKQDTIVVPAGKIVNFTPGGLHMMLFGLTEPLKEDQVVTLILLTEDDQQISFDAVVASPKKHSHH
ncbi:copper chaperone PCu(A)C [Paraglaciecola sp. L1A13]|uniref:copper chaperone PCu(A)C n=1 Tax=Paraglaciecola sp. L1A13 TaxID=2686359 RepID=UPI00131CAB78|nr:copper chaperone PCu(A)C [Paraglaciecola sp. L1A13]